MLIIKGICSRSWFVIIRYTKSFFWSWGRVGSRFLGLRAGLGAIVGVLFLGLRVGLGADGAANILSVVVSSHFYSRPLFVYFNLAGIINSYVVKFS